VRIATIVLLASALGGGAAIARPLPPTPRVPPFAFTANLAQGLPRAVCFSPGEVAHARRLTGLGYAETAWSPDGKRLAVAGGRATTNSIRVETAAGKRLRPVTSPRLATEEDSNPAWSPDGKTIAFSRYVFYGRHTDYRRAGIWTVDLADGRERHLTQRFGDVLAWSPTGDVIAADLGNHDGGEEIELLSAKGGVVARFELAALDQFDRERAGRPTAGGSRSVVARSSTAPGRSSRGMRRLRPTAPFRWSRRGRQTARSSSRARPPCTTQGSTSGRSRRPTSTWRRREEVPTRR
jgi:dipeptidyl aminopeptidase/acylaminoacyl peptidase